MEEIVEKERVEGVQVKGAGEEGVREERSACREVRVEKECK